jgi:outer membrane protein
MLPILFAALTVVQQSDTLRLPLADAMAMARTRNTAFLREQLNLRNATLEMSNERADRYLPEVNLNLLVPAYTSQLSRRSSVDDDGQVVERIGREQRRSFGVELEVSQPLLTGGTLRVTGEVGSDKQPLLDPLERFNSSTALGISLSQEFFGVNNSIRDYRLAREEYERAQAEFIDEERDIAADVIEAYFDLVKARKQSIIDSVTYLRDSIRNSGTRTRAAGQAITEVDSLKFELEAARSAFNRTRSHQELREAEAALNEVLSLPTGTVVLPDTVVRVERFVADVTEGLRSAYANRYDVRLAQMSVANREAALRDARRTSPITVSIDASIGYDGSGVSNEALRALRDAYGRQSNAKDISVEISVPIFDRFREKNAVAEARNELRDAELELEQARRSLENQIRLASQGVTNAATQLTLAEKQVDLTRRTLVIQTRRYSAGEVGSLEFLSDQADAREAEIALVEAQVRVLLAAEEWRRAIGQRSLISEGAQTSRDQR